MYYLLHLLKNRFCHHPNNPTNLKLQLQPSLLQLEQLHNHKTPQSHSFINIKRGLTILRRVLQSLHNSVYPTILLWFITWSPTQSYILTTSNQGRNAITITKYPPKRFDNQSNRKASIHCHIKVKRLKKPHQQSVQNTESTKVNTIMEQLDQWNGNRHRHNTNTNLVGPLLESDNKDGTKHRTKPKTQIIVLSENDKAEKN